MACSIPTGDNLEHVESRRLVRGDHIAAKGLLANLDESLKVLRVIVGDHNYHHGIYMDMDDNEVVHVQGNSAGDAKPKTGDLLDDFMAGSRVTELNSTASDAGTGSVSSVE